MKAIILQSPGPAENLSIAELPIPTIKDGEALVKVRSISINPVDIKSRNGKAMFNQLQSSPPIILGWDIAGEIIETSTNEKFKKGDQVFGMVNFPGAGKAYAEFVVAPLSQLSKKPSITSYEDAAGACLAALTAFQVLVHQLKIEKGKTIFIHAAAGGVGHFAVQIAKHFGLIVQGSASSENHSYLRSIGVDTPVDYSNADYLNNLSKPDYVLDPLGGEVTRKSYDFLQPKGKLVSIVGGVKEEDKEIYNKKEIQASNYLVHSSGEDMESIATLLQKGVIKVHTSHVFPFEKMADAHRQIETGKTRGKVVVNLH